MSKHTFFSFSLESTHSLDELKNKNNNNKTHSESPRASAWASRPWKRRNI